MRRTVGVLLAVLLPAVLWLDGCTGSPGAAGKKPGPGITTDGPPSDATPDVGTQTTATRTRPGRGSTVVVDPSAAGRGSPSDAPVDCPSGGATVHDAAGLTAALRNAVPGAVIRLADGLYSGHFVATTPGTADRPIWWCGGPGAVIEGGAVSTGYAVHLDAAPFWRLVGFTVRGAQKGVVLDGSSDCVLQGLIVTGTGDEAIHLRSGTSRCVVRGNAVSHTGLRTPNFGEGIYVGSAIKNWPTYGSAGGPDRSDHDLLVDNHISGTTSEQIDIKEGTTGGTLSNNAFDGSNGLTAADSWVDVKGNEWLIQGNHGVVSLVDGFQVHSILDGWGRETCSAPTPARSAEPDTESIWPEHPRM